MTVFDPATFSLEPSARRITKPWGYEVLLTPPDVPYTAKLIHVHAGKRLSLQLHDTKVETQTLVAGRGILVLEGADGQLHDIDMQPGVGYHVNYVGAGPLPHPTIGFAVRVTHQPSSHRVREAAQDVLATLLEQLASRRRP